MATQPTVPDQSSELVFLGDHLYRREVNMRRVQNTEEFLMNLCQNHFSMQLIPFSFTPFAEGSLAERVFLSAASSGGSDVTPGCFVQIRGFPFVGSYLVKNDRLTDERGHEVYNAFLGETNGFTPEELGLIRPEGPLLWKPAGLHIFLFFQFKSDLTRYHSDPLFFVVDPNRGAWTPNLPNIYPDGRICGGEDFQPGCHEDCVQRRDVFCMLEHLVDTFGRASNNQDLRHTDAEVDNVMFDSSGNTIFNAEDLREIPVSREPDEDEDSFWMPVSNYNILQFYRWRRHIFR